MKAFCTEVNKDLLTLRDLGIQNYLEDQWGPHGAHSFESDKYIMYELRIIKLYIFILQVFCDEAQHCF